MRMVILLLLLAGLAQSQAQSYCTPNQCPSRSSFAMKQVDRTSNPTNYFYLGAVLGVHEAGVSTNLCGSIRSSAVHNLEAFLWAVSTFQSRYNKLGKEAIGAVVFDSCMQSSKAIQQILNLETEEVRYV